MNSRAFGWIQNPSDFQKLKLVVQVFDSESQHYANLRDTIVPDVIYFKSDRRRFVNYLTANIEEFSYLDLVGTQRNKQNTATNSRSE